MTIATTLTFNDVHIGQTLPTLDIDISTRMIVSTAIASRDYQNVHHDKEAAQSLGSPDIFVNILTTNGLVGRFVTDWTGPEAFLRKVNIRLGIPNYPGDVMQLSGEVVAKSASDNTVELSITGKNKLGNHVTGTVIVALP